MKVTFHREAAKELTLAGDWYDARRPGLGSDLLEEISRAVKAVEESPGTWPRVSKTTGDPEIRHLLLTRFPFSLVYLMTTEGTVVLAVAHQRRRPGYWLPRATSE